MQIERQLEKATGKRFRLFVRTMRDVAKMIIDCPFTPQDGETVHIVILKKKPDKQAVETLLYLRSNADDFAVVGKQVYNLRHDRDTSIFSNSWVEKILSIAGTTRNLSIIKKLNEKYR